MFRMTETKVDKGKQKLFTHRLSAFASAVKKFDYIFITSLIRSFPYADLWEYLPHKSFFCKKVLTNDCFYGKISGATMVDARRVCDLSSFFHFFRSKFQILLIFTNSQKVFCIYSPKIGAIMVLLRRIFTKSTPKIKKIAQFFNKFFV